MNLLPKTEKENLKKGLKLRFVILVSFLLAGSFLAGLIMFLPSYFLASSYLNEATTVNYFLKPKGGGSVKDILNLPNEINLKLSFFQSDVKSASIADYFSKIVNFLPAGVRLNSVSFSKNQDSKEKKNATILVSGISTDRDSLILFSNLLKKSETFSDVSIPVSDLTKSVNLPFTITIYIKNE
jgi:hypothetical protein